MIPKHCFVKKSCQKGRGPLYPLVDLNFKILNKKMTNKDYHKKLQKMKRMTNKNSSKDTVEEPSEREKEWRTIWKSKS